MTNNNEQLPQRQRFVGGGTEVAGKKAGGNAATLEVIFKKERETGMWQALLFVVDFFGFWFFVIVVFCFELYG